MTLRDELGRAEFLTVAEAAKFMRVSKMTVYRLVHMEELPHVRIGRQLRLPARAVAKYLDLDGER